MYIHIHIYIIHTHRIYEINIINLQNTVSVNNLEYDVIHHLIEDIFLYFISVFYNVYLSFSRGLSGRLSFIT